MAILNKRDVGRKLGENQVYIGRPSPYGNPFRLRNEGERNQVIDEFEKYLKRSIKKGTITKREIAALHGKDLVCWCAPKACHGDVLERYAEKYHKELTKKGVRV